MAAVSLYSVLCGDPGIIYINCRQKEHRVRVESNLLGKQGHANLPHFILSLK